MNKNINKLIILNISTIGIDLYLTMSKKYARSVTKLNSYKCTNLNNPINNITKVNIFLVIENYSGNLKY